MSQSVQPEVQLFDDMINDVFHLSSHDSELCPCDVLLYHDHRNNEKYLYQTTDEEEKPRGKKRVGRHISVRTK